jgi:hypothetical protein
MSNPYAAFAEKDEEDTYLPASTVPKAKRTHAEKRAFKQQQDIKKNSEGTSAITTEPLPENMKKNVMASRNPRHPPTPVTKQLGEGHFHDKRSGTGRTYICFYLVTNLEKLLEVTAMLVIKRTL